MSTKILRQGLATLLKSNIIEILSDMPGASKAVDLLKENFTFTAAEIAKNFQDSYGYALAAISSGLAAPENQRGFWQSLLQANVESEFSQRLESDYLLPFAQNLAAENLSAFRETVVQQCQQMATLTLFQADNVPFSEADLAGFVSASEANSMTDLVLELVQTQQALDERVLAFLQFKELLGNALLFFLHEQLRKEPRFQSTLAALQRDGLIIEVREIKNIVLSTENKLNQAVTEKRFASVVQLGQQLERLQQIESVTQTHYGQFLEFSQHFADWAQLVNVQLEKVLAALPKLQAQLGGIKSDTEEILAIVQQLKARADLSDQIKPRDELTQYSSANLELIKKAQQLLKRISPSSPQYSRVVIGLGSIVSSQGDLKQAEALFTKAYQQAGNNNERALSAFNLFQVFTRQQIYDKALFYLQEAIKLNAQRYALHNVHTYALQRLLGAGGMGCVFLALHRLKKESVVIKCFWETLHGTADALFQEAFLMAEIAGEYVPQPLDCGFVDSSRQERGYFISEYIKGAIDGETWLAKYGKLDVQTGIAVGLQIAKGLQLAHDKGIFHLDLKPANILLQRRKTSEVSVKIIDFGLAKVAPSLGQEIATRRSRSGLSLLAQTAVFGTLDYAPPEQQGMTRYGTPSAKSDVYAFGKTLYRLLTGESPQTLHPRRLANAPELFELLCDCVEIDQGKRLDVATIIIQLSALHAEIIKTCRTWWSQLNDNWKKIFKKAIEIKNDPSDTELVKIVNLQKLDFKGDWGKKGKISDLEPLRTLTNLQELNCFCNQISDLEPLSALTNLQKLDCQGNQLSNLEPLSALMNLQELYCVDNQISDLEPLHALTNLRDLNCGYNKKISDLKPLHALTKLQKLHCRSNQLSDLEPLRALTNLQKLDCSLNQLSDLEPLRALTNLRDLNCSYNQISDLEPLRALTNLRNLDCGYNKKISDLEPLRALTNLQKLHCHFNKLSDLEPLCTLTNLQNLDCTSNKISNLEPLRALTNLRSLGCASNKISNLEPLRALTNLRSLICWGNQLSDLELLRALTNLRVLWCQDNQLSDLEPLRALTNLQVLWCGSNKLSDLEPIRALTNLQELDCWKNQFSDLEPLRTLTNLQKLACSKNQLSDLEPLRPLTKLQRLHCQENQLSDLEPLRPLTNLQYLDCRGNQLSDLEIDKFKKAVPNCKVSS